MQAAGLDAGGIEIGEQAPHAEAAHLLVVGEGEVQRHFEARLRELGHQRERHGEEAFHVAGAAAVEPALALVDREGIARPFLAVDRHHVGVAGEHDATLAVGRPAVGRPDRGEEIRLRAGLVVHEARRDAVLREIVAHPMDQREIGIAAGRVERDQAAQHLDGGGARSHSRVPSETQTLRRLTAEWKHLRVGARCARPVSARIIACRCGNARSSDGGRARAARPYAANARLNAAATPA